MGMDIVGVVGMTHEPVEQKRRVSQMLVGQRGRLAAFEGCGPDLVLDDELLLHSADLREAALHAVVDILRCDVLDGNLPYPGRVHAKPALRGGDLLQYFQRLGVDVNRGAVLLRLRLDGIDGDAHRVSQKLDLRDQIRSDLIDMADRDAVRLLGMRRRLEHVDHEGRDASPGIGGRCDGQAGSRDHPQAARDCGVFRSQVCFSITSCSVWNGAKVAGSKTPLPGWSFHPAEAGISKGADSPIACQTPGRPAGKLMRVMVPCSGRELILMPPSYWAARWRARVRPSPSAPSREV